MNLIKIPMERDQIKTIKEYLEAFLDAEAGAPETQRILTEVRDKVHKRINWPGQLHDILLTDEQAGVFWEFLTAMIEDKVVLSPAHQAAFFNYQISIARQLDGLTSPIPNNNIL
jgi:hypothetical protein